MIVVDDLRKLLQEMVAPEIRAVSVKTDNLQEKIVDLRGELRAEVKNGVQYVVSQLQLDQRLGKLEEENQRRKQLPEKQ